MQLSSQFEKLSKIGNSNDYVSNEELVTTCKDYGNLYCVVDNIFLLSTTKGVT